MRLLIITQKIDERDAVLGFMHGWVAEFAKQTESVAVICLEKGWVNLPENVRVFSLGKEENNFQFSIFNFQFFKTIKYAWRFVRYIVQNHNDYDAVLVHMNPEYAVLGGLFWKWWGKTVALWYAHKSVTWFLRLGHFFTDIVLTSTASGFRLPSRKVKVIGQGIDTDRFNTEHGTRNRKHEEFKIVTVGRITPAKDYDTLIEAVSRIRDTLGKPVKVDIIGPVSVASDERYLRHLKETISQKNLTDIVVFRGPVANGDLSELLSGYDLFVNMGLTGSLDKAVLEPMASGLPVLTCNEAFMEVLGPYKSDLMYPKGDAEILSGKILKVAGLSETARLAMGENLRAIVVSDHSLETFVRKIIVIIESFKNHERS